MTIKLNAATGGGSVSLSAPNSTTSNLDVELTLPVDDGAANTFLKSDGSGTLSWASASSDSITEGNTTVECVDTGSDGHITFDTEGSEQARFDPSGRLLINTTSEFGTSSRSSFYSLFQVKGNTSGSTSDGRIALGTGATVGSNTGLGSFYFCDQNGGDRALIRGYSTSAGGSNNYPGYLTFWTNSGAANPTERMRIHDDGNVSINSSSAGYQLDVTSSGVSHPALGIRQNNTSFAQSSFFITVNRTTTNSSFNFLRCLAVSSDRCFIRDSGTIENATGTYNSISDIKLKENIVDAPSQWDDIKNIRIRNYNFKIETDYSTHKQIGVVAQELELVCPGLVEEAPDQDPDGNDLGTTTKTVKSSILYMKAVKALQEAQTRIEALETANASLEARLTALEGGAS
jgi:hypothetical protein